MIDPQVLAGLAPLRAEPAPDRPAVGDVATRRVNARRMFEQLAAARPAVRQIDVRSYQTVSEDGTAVPLRWYRPAGSSSAPGGAVLYLHGGGMIFGMEDVGGLYDSVVRGYVTASGVPMLVVDYRIAPEFAHPVPLQDCCAGLVWLAGHAGELGADPARLAVMGDSAGGGLAAGLCLWARDRGGPPVARQLLVYPMLDDRTSAPDSRLLPFATWTYDDNVTGWHALLGEAAGGAGVSPYAAAARAADLSGLPSAYLDVGELDVFRDEDVGYARRLGQAGVPTELHVHPGCPHAFELLAPDADVSRRAVADRVRVLRSV
ncbi:alpha/beta hydrolase [Mycobacterium sp.]|uniref:alpha/beta hydrolase n=1 Tax=Mycobacterium sp. TaxID=1785 RepID=UPI0031DD2A87